MAGFHTKTFAVYDDYATPASAWEAVAQYVPKGVTIWEPFYLDGSSGDTWERLGWDVIHDGTDFYTHTEAPGDVIISNPPYSDKARVFERLKQLDKPFMMLCPSSMLCTQYIRRTFGDDPDPLQVIIPRKRIQFLKSVEGEMIKPGACNFDCFYYCWRLNLPREIVWLA